MRNTSNIMHLLNYPNLIIWTAQIVKSAHLHLRVGLWYTTRRKE